MTDEPLVTSTKSPVVITQKLKVWDGFQYVTYVVTQRNDSAEIYRQGWKHSSWRDHIRNLRDATTPFFSNRIEVKFSELGSYYGLRPSPTPPLPGQPDNKIERDMSNYLAAYVTTAYTPGFPVVSSPSARNQAIEGILNQLNNINSGEDLGEELGEVRETLHGLKQPLSSFKGLLESTVTGFQKKLARGRLPRNLKDKLKTIDKIAADTYLEFQFGWVPTARSVTSALLGLKGKSLFHVVPLYSKGKVEGLNFLSSLDQESGPLVRITDKSVTSQTVKFRGAVNVGSYGQGLNVAPSYGQLPGQFISTAYNLIPWTFVADYFSNLGGIVKRLGTISFGLIYLAETTETATERIVTAQFIDDFGFQVFNQTPGVLNNTYRNITRARNLSVPWPSFEVKLPSANDSAWQNLAALVLSKSGGIAKLISRVIG